MYPPPTTTPDSENWIVLGNENAGRHREKKERMYVSLVSERTRSFWKSAVAVAASFALRACERASERENDMRGGALVLQRGGGGGRVARRTPNSPSVAQACRVSANAACG